MASHILRQDSGKAQSQPGYDREAGEGMGLSEAWEVITLPTPPSTNNLFINARSGKGRFLSPAYKAWRKSAAAALTLCAWDMPSKPYAITIRVNIDHRRDLDNSTKAVLDLLVAHQVIDGDQWVNELHVYRDRTVDGCTVTFG